MKASWRQLGILLISTQAVGCFGVRYRDSMALPTCDATCQTATSGLSGSHGHHAREEQPHQVVAYDQPMIPPRPKFHPVPTRPAFAPRVEYTPPELIRTPILVEVPDGPILEPMLAPRPAEPLNTPSPVEKTPPLQVPAPLKSTAPLKTPPLLTAPPSLQSKTPQPLPPPTVDARPIIAPLPQQINLDQPNEIRKIQNVWRTKQSS